jgi:signal transduction histidine kinase
MIFFEDILADVKQDIAPLLEKSASVITTQLEIPAIEFQKKNLRSILYNLVSNAVKYRAANRQNLIHIHTFKQADGVVLQVKDNGLGINTQQQEKLFQMFRRFHPHVEGTGIGLYIVKRIVENNGGSIKVNSTEGEGTTFTIFFKSNSQ